MSLLSSSSTAATCRQQRRKRRRRRGRWRRGWKKRGKRRRGRRKEGRREGRREWWLLLPTFLLRLYQCLSVLALQPRKEKKGRREGRKEGGRDRRRLLLRYWKTTFLFLPLGGQGQRVIVRCPLPGFRAIKVKKEGGREGGREEEE